jgi:apolipoprotein N-acyltransferase
MLYAAAVVAGVLTGLSWQPYGLWPLLLLGIPAFTLLLRGVRRRRAFALGYVYGVAMLALSISWVHVLGVWIAVLLIAFEALFFALLGVAINLVTSLRWWPLAAACCWVLTEFLYSRFPFGGFGWGKLAYAAVDTPLAGFFPLIGVVGVSFLIALLGQLVAYLVVRLWSRQPGLGRALVVPLAIGLAVVASGIGLRMWQVGEADDRQAADPVNVGIVQGNVPGRGIEALGRARTVTNNHLAETVNLTVKARLGQVGQPDFILWPENSTDIDPLADAPTRTTVQTAAEVAGRPILVGAVMQGPGVDERQTTALWWDPDRGVVDRYVKRNLVPFGEWIPFRQQLLPVIPLLAKVGAQSVAGTEPGVLTVPVGDREVKVGDIICFELAYDGTVYDTVTNGAQILVVQSNNATYGGTGQIEQQFAITRARAMEARREIAVATTNSVSGHIDHNGRVTARTAEFTADSMVFAMPVRFGLTPAITLAPWLERGLAVVGLLACLLGLQLAMVRAVRARRAATAPPRAEKLADVPAEGSAERSGDPAAADPAAPPSEEPRP